MKAVKTIYLEARPAIGGWCILAMYDGQHYRVEVGVKDPILRLEYWRENVHHIAAAIKKVSSKSN